MSDLAKYSVTRNVYTACSSPTVDVVFVVDGSGSIGSTNFNKIKSFIARVVDSFDISSKAVRVGLIQFSSNAAVLFDLQRYSNKENVKAAVAETRYLRGGKQTAVSLTESEMRRGVIHPLHHIFIEKLTKRNSVQYEGKISLK